MIYVYASTYTHTHTHEIIICEFNTIGQLSYLIVVVNAREIGNLWTPYIRSIATTLQSSLQKGYDNDRFCNFKHESFFCRYKRFIIQKSRSQNDGWTSRCSSFTLIRLPYRVFLIPVCSKTISSEKFTLLYIALVQLNSTEPYNGLTFFCCFVKNFTLELLFKLLFWDFEFWI